MNGLKAAIIPILVAAFLLGSCTTPPEEMTRRESAWEGPSGKESIDPSCDYVANAFFLDPLSTDDWFYVEIPWDANANPVSVIPPTLWGQRMGVATYVHETVRHFMGALSKLIFMMFGAIGIGFVLQLAAILMIMFWGLGVILGYTNEGSGYGLFLTVFKMSVILYFATNWDGFSENVRSVVEAVVDDFTALVAVVFSPSHSFEDVCHVDPTRMINLPGLGWVPIETSVISTVMSEIGNAINNAQTGVPAAARIKAPTVFPHSTWNNPGPFCIVDYTFSQFWNFKMIKVLLACIFSGFSGWIYGLILAWAMIGYLFAMVSAMWVFLIAFIARSLLYAIAPLFIGFALFKQTRSLFDGWVQQLFNFTLQPMFLFAFLGIFHKMINEMFKVTLERIDIETVSQPVNAAAQIKSQTLVCYERLTTELEYPLYWWRFRVDQGSAQKVVEGYNADNPINLFSILIVAILVHIMKNLTQWVVLAASSISQGFLSAATVPVHGVKGGNKFAEDSDAAFKQ